MEIPLIRHSGAGRTGSGANRKKQIDDAADIVPPLLAAAEQFVVQAADTRLALAPYRAETVVGVLAQMLLLVWRDNQDEKRATIRMRIDVATRPRVT